MEKCDVCGSTENVTCEVYMNGNYADRVYHLCPTHWVDLYRKAINDFMEDNEYKVSAYLKGIADKMIVDSYIEQKMETIVGRSEEFDLEDLAPHDIKFLKSEDVIDG